MAKNLKNKRCLSIASHFYNGTRSFHILLDFLFEDFSPSLSRLNLGLLYYQSWSDLNTAERNKSITKGPFIKLRKRFFPLSQSSYDHYFYVSSPDIKIVDVITLSRVGAKIQSMSNQIVIL